MQSTQRKSSLAVAVILALTLSGNAAAQVIRITNANNHEIPLRAGSSVQIDVAGNLLAECALNGSNVCTQLSTGGGTPVGAPTAALSRTDGDTDVRTGEFVRLTWSSTAALVCNAASTGPVATTWSGPRAISNGTGEVVTLGTAGSYAFTLQCFNAIGASSVLSQSAEVLAATGGGGTPSGCNITPGDALFQPPSLTGVTLSWVEAFSATNNSQIATYPSSPGAPVAVGAQKNGYTAIPFVAMANRVVDMTWDTAQANFGYGYNQPRPAESMFIGLSPCPGDLRAPSPVVTSDTWLMNGCRKVAGQASMFYTTSAAAVTTQTVCKLEAGQTYYLNFSPIDPTDGLTSGEHTCSPAANSNLGCDVQVRHTGNFTD